jgi:hypothetical protein
MPARPSVNRTGITSIRRAARKAGEHIEYTLTPRSSPRFTPTLSTGPVRKLPDTRELHFVGPPVPIDGIPDGVGPGDIKMTGSDGDLLRSYLKNPDPAWAELARQFWEEELKYRKMEVRTRLYRTAGDYFDEASYFSLSRSDFSVREPSSDDSTKD